MKIAEVMTTNVQSIDSQATLMAAAQHMRRLDVGSLPVCDSTGKLVGVVTDRDLTVRGTAESLDPTRARVADVMTTKVICGTVTQDVADITQLMREHRVRRIPVVDNQRLVGIVALADLALECKDDKQLAAVVERVSEPTKKPAA